MKNTSTRFFAAAIAGLLGLAPASQAATKIDSTTITALASSELPGDRAAAKTLDGETSGAGPFQIFVAGGGNPGTPADWRQNATIEPTSNFGQGTSWLQNNGSVVTPPDEWIIFDLGADMDLDTMNIFPLALESVSANSNRSIRDAKIYYSAAATGIASNTHLNDTAFDPTGFTLHTTLTGATEVPQPTGGETAMLPHPVDLTGVTARYVAIDIDASWGNALYAAIGEVQFFAPAGFVDDPILLIDVSSPHPDYTYGNIFDGGTPPTRTLTFVNSSDSGSETITIDSITLADDGGGTFAITSAPATPLVLNHTDTFSLEVTATATTSGNAVGSLEILTTSSGGIVAVDFNDKVIPLNATAYMSGDKLNPNPFMESGLANYDNIAGLNVVAVSPGLSGGSLGMARVQGSGDPANITAAGSFMQSTGVPNGATNWQLSAFFTPIQAASLANDAAAAANFASYADPDGTLGITEAEGAAADRTFQLIVMPADTGRPFPTFGDFQADSAMINIAYMPAGIQTDTTPGFYVYDALGGAWEFTGIGEIKGSLDFDTDTDSTNGTGDGILDPNDVNDDINAYRILVTGTGFGTVSASYTITVTKFSGTDTFTTATSAPLSFFQGVSGTTNTPAGYSFITSDISSGANGSNLDLGITTPFWVDDVCYFNGVGPDPLLTVLSTPDMILVTSPDTTGTTSFILRNDGTSTALDVTSIDTGTSGFSVTSATSFTIAPGALAQIDLEWDSANSQFTPIYEEGTVSIIGSNFTTVDFGLTAGILQDYNKVLNNFDFETPGTDPGTDADTFANWAELLNPTAITDSAGLIAPSITSATLAAASVATSTLGQSITSPPLNNFTIDFDFSMAVTTANRDIYLFPTSPSSRTNIAYAGGNFVAFDGGGGTGFQPVLNVALSAGTPYKLQVTGSNWGTLSPSQTVEVFDAGGSSLGVSAPFSFYQGGLPSNGLSLLEFTTQFGNGGGCTVDEICISGQGLDTSPPANFAILNPVYSPGAPNTVTADITGAAMDIYRSVTGLPGSWATTGVLAAGPGAGIVIDPDASPTTALYIGVTPGGSAP